MARQCGCLGGIENCTFCYGSGYLPGSDHLRLSDARRNWGPAAPGPHRADPWPGGTNHSTRPSATVRRSVVYGGPGMRVNELARELEVNSSVILELLPELGISDRKTHSSWLDDSLVGDLRRLIDGIGEGGVPSIVQTKRTAPRISPTSPALSGSKPDVPKETGSLIGGYPRSGSPKKRLSPSGIARARALATGKGHSGPADDNTDVTQLSELENYWIERRRDGSRDYWQFRETGKFGSHPLYDDCGDESAP